MPPILYVHHRPQASGAVRSLSLLIGALGSRWQPHALVPDGPAAEVLADAGAEVHTGPVPAFTHTWDVQYQGLRWLVLGREALALPTHLRQLDRLLRRVSPAIVHLNDSVLLPTGWLAHRRGFPVVWHLRSSLASEGVDRRSRWVSGRVAAWGDAAIAIDHDVARTFAPGLPLHVVGNPVVAEPGEPLSLDIPPGRVTIAYVGYLRRQKGWPELLDALRLLVDDGAPVHAVVVGGGVRPEGAFRGFRGTALRAAGIPNEELDFRRRVEELGLEDRVTLLPFTLDPSGVYRAVDIVVFPNQGSGLGRPVLEAAAYGKPVVASGSRTGAGLIRDGETGVLLREGTPEALAETLGHLVREPELRERLGGAALAHVLASFDPGVVARRVEELYEAIAGA